MEYTKHFDISLRVIPASAIQYTAILSPISRMFPMDGHRQTWKKAWTRGHYLRKFLRIVEISGLWKIDYSYFLIKLMNCENFF